MARRKLLNAGLIIAGAPFCPEALFDGRAAAADKNPSKDAPIGPREIVKGLDVMSRVAEKRNTFGFGHNAAAVISSMFFCREQKLDADAQKEILAYLDARLLKNPIYAAARPKEVADPKLTEGLLEDLDAGIAKLRGKGHNIIFAVTCLKARCPKTLSSVASAPTRRFDRFRSKSVVPNWTIHDDDLRPRASVRCQNENGSKNALLLAFFHFGTGRRVEMVF
jgi:hypothetical protein